jgi:hypothetical protein
MKKLFIFLFLIIAGYSANAQNFDYKIRYDTASCKYQAYAVANAVLASKYAFGAQFTIVVPASMANSAVTGITTVSPGGTSSWSLNTVAYNSASNDYYPVALSAAGTYPAVASGDSILLFSFELNNTVCASNVRPWNSTTDAATIGGNSYANSLQMLTSPTEQYAGNDATDADLTDPTISSLVANCQSSLHGINLTASLQGNAASNCGTTSYSWTGPNGFTATTQNITVADNANSVGSYTATVTDNFGCSTSSSLTLDSTNCFIAPVPVTMLYFTGERVNGVNKLNWSTASELNNSHFILERRINDGVFEYLDEVKSSAANGNSNSILKYAYDDANVHTKGATVYYTLTQVDYDGTRETFGPVKINIDAPGNIVVYPNPATDHIYVQGLSIEDDNTIDVFDALGKIVLTQDTDNLETDLDVTGLNHGLYTIRVSSQRGVLSSYKVVIRD